ncbi:MAG: NAD-dependent epimerase/dehydratase family protein, partial [Ktedonobacterales bacterium]
MLKVLVAGGAGFIGSHLCARLLREGHSVVCVDNLLTGAERNIAPLRQPPTTPSTTPSTEASTTVPDARFTFVQRDVTEPLDVARDLEGFRPEAIFQLASPASPVGYW